ncbi:thiamine-phosphate kinase [Marinobacter orientalis]|uniref:Thiamine-monophosphate kinase n=1 Tax=Marinobacter orientalis TaxID=1928859 RepID=A0A7Y0RFV2_9GAMM|nr:thiamine-phosphate kinase [Marinobacter orientalis]NMT65496.1 thiamine-phosphate kinase [Marinobacter orientalis]TGX47120.1 thiamine-phosphate kinase [Marinobacter orientalis]
MGEFELIRHYFFPIAEAGHTSAVVLGPGDDCAIQQIEPGRDLVFSVDALVEGVHFPPHYDPEKLGWRCLAVAASDLAAMGADPVCFTLALTLPDADPDWLHGFARGLASAAKHFGLALAGGDTTRGPLTLSLQVHGTVPRGQAIRRSGARAGDYICVSGTLGGAGAALDYLGSDNPGADEQALLVRYHYPEARLDLGVALRGYASAAVDISDGLVADLGHILAASGVAASIDATRLPVSAALKRLAGEDAVNHAMNAGDDYELCITISPQAWESLPEDIRGRLTIIGEVKSGEGLAITHNGQSQALAAGGYDHFRT